MKHLALLICFIFVTAASEQEVHNEEASVVSPTGRQSQVLTQNSMASSIMNGVVLLGVPLVLGAVSLPLFFLWGGPSILSRIDWGNLDWSNIFGVERRSKDVIREVEYFRSPYSFYTEDEPHVGLGRESRIKENLFKKRIHDEEDYMSFQQPDQSLPDYPPYEPRQLDNTIDDLPINKHVKTLLKLVSRFIKPHKDKPTDNNITNM